MKSLSLYELNNMLREVVKRNFSSAYWVMAEISEFRIASNGHCYLELIQKSEQSNTLVARASAHIWRSAFYEIQNRFLSTAGAPLRSGLKVLVAVSVDFHEQYGYSLNILDIDPSYTLGDMARKRKEIIDRLKREGIFDLNKLLSLPRLLQRIAVISAENAAGYGDFQNQLAQSGYKFRCRLFPAIMQGDFVEQSIIAALEKIALEAENWDAVAIIRGGGAVSDLSGFETYDLACNVANFPLPVLTGIGHERDETILDLIARIRLKTPTAVAAFLIDHAGREVAQIADYGARIEKSVIYLLQEKKTKFDSLARRLQYAAGQFSANNRQQLYTLMAMARSALQTRLQKERYRTESLPEKWQRSLEQYFLRERDKLLMLEKQLKFLGPDHILKMGYTLTTVNGKIIAHAEELKKGDLAQTIFMDGKAESIVQNVHSKQQ